MRTFVRKLKWITERARKEDDLRAELEFHLQQEAEERQAAGVSADDARRAARLELGNVGLIQEDTRAAWGWVLVEQFGQDLRYGLRAMGRNPLFTLLAVLSLALGIGANVAIYSFMDALLLRSLPISDPKSLVVLNWKMRTKMHDTVVHSASGDMQDEPGGGLSAGIFAFPAFEVLRTSADGVFSSVFAYYPTRKVNFMVNGQAELASGEYVSGDYFRGLAAPAVAGRVIGPDDDRTGAEPVAVLSFGYCQRRFGDPASAIGQAVLINNVPARIAGVARPGFTGIDPSAIPDFYIPVHTNVQIAEQGPRSEKMYLEQNYYWLGMMARLRPDVSLAQAQAALAPVFRRWAATTANTDQERANLPELVIKEGAAGLDTLRQEYSKPLYVLLAMVGLILAIACVNIANLLLARATSRQREIAVRLSMGAGRIRVVRQLMTESLLLSAIGGTLGVLFALWGIRFLRLLLENGESASPLNAELNWHVLAAAVTLSVVTGLLFGLAPALQSTRVDLMSVMKEAQGADWRPRLRFAFLRFNLNQTLVVSQIAISLLMLIGAGLFLRTLSNLQSIQLGFNRDHLLLFRMNAAQAGHKEPEIIGFYSDLRNRFGAIPGVRAASVANSPLLGEGAWFSNVLPAGQQAKADGALGHGNAVSVTPHVLMAGSGFFSTMGIPVLLGRAIDERDQPGSLPVAVVNEVYAKTWFAGQNPLGRHVVMERRAPENNSDVEIVGVAKNARYGELRGSFPPVVYIPFNQGTAYPVQEMTFTLRTNGDPLRYINAVREIAHGADPRVPVTNVRTEAAQVDQAMNQEIVFARLCTGFGVLALLIACVGLYGTMAYSVARRTGEIGVRMALGAARARVVRMVMSRVIALVIAGLAVGVAISYAAGHLLDSYLYGIRPNDPVALGVAIGLLTLAGLIAGYAPARRASRIDPMIALRHE